MWGNHTSMSCVFKGCLIISPLMFGMGNLLNDIENVGHDYLVLANLELMYVYKRGSWLQFSAIL